MFCSRTSLMHIFRTTLLFLYRTRLLILFLRLYSRIIAHVFVQYFSHFCSSSLHNNIYVSSHLSVRHSSHISIGFPSHKNVECYPTRLFLFSCTLLLNVSRTRLWPFIRQGYSLLLVRLCCFCLAPKSYWRLAQQSVLPIAPIFSSTLAQASCSNQAPPSIQLLYQSFQGSCNTKCLKVATGTCSTILQICMRKVSRQSYTNITPINSSDYVLLSYMFSQKLLSIFGWYFRETQLQWAAMQPAIFSVFLHCMTRINRQSSKTQSVV